MTHVCVFYVLILCALFFKSNVNDYIWFIVFTHTHFFDYTGAPVNSMLFYFIARTTANLRYKNVVQGAAYSYVKTRMIKAGAFLKLKVYDFIFKDDISKI
jgi:hypothetical protein